MAGKGALIVVDMQNDYLWGLRKPQFTYNTEQLVANVNQVIEFYQGFNFDVHYIREVIPNNWLTRKLIGHSLSGTLGIELYEGLEVVSDLIWDKQMPDAFSVPAFRDMASKRNYTEIAVCGLDFCGCAGETAKGAALTGAHVVLLQDCTGTRYGADRIAKMTMQLTNVGVQIQVPNN